MDLNFWLIPLKQALTTILQFTMIVIVNATKELFISNAS